MIDISALLSGQEETLKSIRYSKKCKEAQTGVSVDRGPVVAWNITKLCNFKCKHCYSDACDHKDEKELSLIEIKNIIDDMKVMKVPVILLSGGEPLMHPDILEIIKYIRKAGIRVSISTNGSLITEAKAKELKNLGVGYVGISLDGIGAVNDDFRGVDGAFDAAVRGIRNCIKADQKVGLRMTVHKGNVHEVASVLSFMEREAIDRVCFYHLVPSGRGVDLKDQMMTHEQARRFVELLVGYTLESKEKGEKKEILTVTNHTDGPYIYMLMKDKAPELAKQVLEKLSNNKGNRSGIAILNMDWYGNVYPDQFSKFMPLGSVRETSLRDIWINGLSELKALRNKQAFLNNKCKQCKWLDICGGNLRARAYMTSGDLWGHDPGCYLEESEI